MCVNSVHIGVSACVIVANSRPQIYQCCWNDSNKQFWVTKLYGCSFQAPCCLTQTMTNGNISSHCISSLVGIDAPYFCLLFFKYYYLIFHHYSSDGCYSVV